MFKKIYSLILDNKYLILLITITIVTHLEWFNYKSILTFSDWYYWQASNILELGKSWGTWIYNWNGLGSPNIQIYFNIFYVPWSLLANLGVNYDITSKLNIFIPISLLGFLTPYFYINYKVNDKLIAFICALFYGSTTYFLVLQTAHLPIAFVYSIAPLVLYLFELSLLKNRLFNWIIFSLIFSFTALHEIRIAYILSFILLINFIFLRSFSLKNYFKNIFISTLIVLGINMFWILPVILGGIYSEVGELAGRGLFGDFLTNVNYATTIFHWSWTGGFPDQEFIPQSIRFYFWFLPLFIFSSLLLLKKKEYIKQISFFLVVLLIGIFIVKQSAAPFNFSYELLYERFPGFVLFRESSKFYLMVSIGFLGLLASAMMLVKTYLFRERQFIYKVLVLILAILFFLNLIPLVNKDIGTLFVDRQIPEDYTRLNQIIDINKSEISKSLFVPSYSKWIASNSKSRRISMFEAQSSNWKFNLDNIKDSQDFTEAELMIKSLNFDYSDNLLNLSSIKYVILPFEDDLNDDNFFKFFGKDRNYYISSLDKLEYLKRSNLNFKELLIYENEDYRPHIYLTNEQEDINKQLEYEKVNYTLHDPTRYTVKIENLKKPVYLNFSESYHPQWKIKVGDFKWYNSFSKNYFLNYKVHFKNNANLNSFYLNPEEICNNYKCTKNKDESYNINLTLYFYSQNYFYLGLLISFGTLSSVTIYLVFLFVRKIKNREK